MAMQQAVQGQFLRAVHPGGEFFRPIATCHAQQHGFLLGIQVGENLGNVRGMRLMMCVEYVADKTTKAQLPDEINISKRISNLCEERGLLVRPLGHLDVMSPPLTLTRKEADFLVDTLRGAIEEVTHALQKEGLLPKLSRPFQRGGN